MTGQHNHLCVAACRLETETNMVMRFIIGQTQNDAQEAELMQESGKHGGFLRLDLQVNSAAPQMCHAADTMYNCYVPGLQWQCLAVNAWSDFQNWNITFPS